MTVRKTVLSLAAATMSVWIILSTANIDVASADAPAVHGMTANRRFDTISYICEYPLCFPIVAALWIEGGMHNANEYYCSPPASCREMLHDARVTFRDTTNAAGVSWGVGFSAGVVLVGSIIPYLSQWPYLPPGYSSIPCAFAGTESSIPDYCFWGRPDWLINWSLRAQLEWKPVPGGGWTVTSGATSFEYLWW